MKRLFLSMTAVALALSPLPAQAQEVGDATQRIEAARRRAESAGIPVSLLDSKIAEGRAKGVPVDRLAAAVEQRLLFLTRAREAMGGERPSPSDLSVGADALAAGVSGDALQEVARAAPADRRAVAIAVLQQLVQQGELPEQASVRVRVALAQGPDALRNLPGRGNGLQKGRRGDALAGSPGAAPPRAVPTPDRGKSGDGGPQGKPPRRKPKP